MQDEKWEYIKGVAKDNFEIEEEGEEAIPDIPRSKLEWMIFKGPMGIVKIERATRPIVLDKKTLYSKRMGDTAAVEYVYSEDEYSHTFKAYLWQNDDWNEIDAKNLNL
ncbi:hypothetical protein KJ969_02285 [Patescibacteria group bacterium]|nr:hypothetical protein [Patescibacteria group bacterium]MBU1921676.1 hypothetical protein [Patescibacteria group bacterium]